MMLTSTTQGDARRSTPAPSPTSSCPRLVPASQPPRLLGASVGSLSTRGEVLLREVHQLVVVEG